MVSPPDLQCQQSIVVGDSILAGRKEAGINSHVIFVPVETHWHVGGNVVLSGRDPKPSPKRPGLQPLCCLFIYVTQGSSKPQFFSSVKWE